jgi:hypothetical protein
MPLFGEPDVASLEAKRDVKRLIKALGYKKNLTIGEAAAAALVRIGPPRRAPQRRPRERAAGRSRGCR